MVLDPVSHPPKRRTVSAVHFFVELIRIEPTSLRVRAHRDRGRNALTGVLRDERNRDVLMRPIVFDFVDGW